MTRTLWIYEDMQGNAHITSTEGEFPPEAFPYPPHIVTVEGGIVTDIKSPSERRGLNLETESHLVFRNFSLIPGGTLPPGVHIE